MECLARALFKNGTTPEYVIFTTYQERDDGSTRIGKPSGYPFHMDVILTIRMTDKTLKVPETPFPDLCAIYTSLWRELDPQATVTSEPTIESAIKRAKRLSDERGGSDVFVTGSLHMVGGALNLLRP